MGTLSGLQINLHFALAEHAAGVGLVAALARVDVVVAIAGAAVHGDPHVVEQGAIFFFELGGVGRAQGKDGAPFLNVRVGEIRGLLLHFGGDGRRESAARISERSTKGRNCKSVMTAKLQSGERPVTIAMFTTVS